MTWLENIPIVGKAIVFLKDLFVRPKEPSVRQAGDASKNMQAGRDLKVGRGDTD